MELRDKVWEIREELQTRKSEEIWGTRQLRQAYVLKALGWSQKKVLDSLTFGWSQGLAASCGAA